MRRFHHDPQTGAARNGRARRSRRFGTNVLELLEGRALLSFAVEGLTGVGSSAHGATSIVSNAVATDSSGDKFATGSFYGTVDFGGVQLTSAGGSDAFVAEYNPSGALKYAKSMGGALNDAGDGVAVNAAGEAYVTGTAGSQIFVWKVGTAGNTKFTTMAASTGSAQSMGISVDPAGNNIAIGGSFTGSTTFGGSSLTALAGVRDGFLAKLNGSGSFVWASQFVGSTGASSQINSVAIDSSGNVDGAGQFKGTVDFNPGPRSMMKTAAAGATGLAVVSLNGSTGGLVFADTAGSSGITSATGIAAAPGGRLYVTGVYQDAVNFGSGTLTAQPSATSFYLMELNGSGSPVFAYDLGASNSDLSGTMIGRPSVAVSATGSVVVGATTTGNVNAGTFHLGGTGAADMLLESFDGYGNVTRAVLAGGLANDMVTGVAINASGQIALTGSYSDLIVIGSQALVDNYDPSVAGSNFLVATLAPASGTTYGFDGSNKSEPGVFNPTTNTWTVMTTFGTTSYGSFGQSGDIPVTGDWSQYAHAMLAVYRPSTAQWIVELADGSAKVVATFGATNSDMPVAGNYDGIGESEAAVYRPSTGQWFVNGPFGSHVVGTLGLPGDVPVPGDYDGVGHTEPAVFRPSTGQWLVLGPNGVHQVAVFGGLNLSDIPVPGDYDGVGHTEPAIFRPATGQWMVLGPNGGHILTTFGGTDLATNYPLEGVPGSLLVLNGNGPGIRAAAVTTTTPSPTPVSNPPASSLVVVTPAVVSTKTPKVTHHTMKPLVKAHVLRFSPHHRTKVHG